MRSCSSGVGPAADDRRSTCHRRDADARRKGIDDKIVAVSVKDPACSDHTDKSQLLPRMLREIRRFCQDYKVLEQKQVIVEDMLGVDDALWIIRAALELYRQLRRGRAELVADAAGIATPNREILR
jgi:hypothetical protein